ncbi:flagellar export chaperone FlgN [Pseudoduganella namucuonensis]|uniref:Flagella synthesis protein FlgN n=1 Tax=Pseudoduganella namucuonensis TaxID=1035707 RepID=A0A1I7HU23_9BURK|nr:flagellar export chaperone FlgN [Pseudoduganella namucuonensis]SFU64234.1 flagella synthesis protein FlgN [Pseudoduganella namucuonensis]
MNTAVAATGAAANPATRQEAMQQFLQGVAADTEAYQALLDLLEQQFHAALRHQSARLGEVAEAVSALADTLELRRRQRVALATQLAGPDATMAQVYALLKPELRARLEQDWRRLETMVTECKRLGKRNSDLLVDQYTIMQRVLHGEDQIYEPV